MYDVQGTTNMRTTEMFEGVWRFETGLPGRAIAITGGVHGNEITGIEVVRAMLAGIAAGAIELRSGSLYVAYGNQRAIERGSRGSENHKDLNRVFTERVLVDYRGADYECYRARQLADALKGVDILVDVHATTKPAEPFFFCQRLPTDADKGVLQHFDVGKVLSDPQLVFAGEPVAIDEYVSRRGGVGLCYETGHMLDTSRLSIVLQEINALLVRERVIHGSLPLFPKASEKVVCAIRAQLMCVDPDRFSFAPGCGEYSFQPFSKGQVIAFNGDIETVATFDGVSVFPKPVEYWEKNKPAAWLAERVS